MEHGVKALDEIQRDRLIRDRANNTGSAHNVPKVLFRIFRASLSKFSHTCSALAVLGLALFSVSCLTTFWYPQMAPVGAILDEGQQEADVDLLFFIPSALRYARGMAGGSELDFGLVCTGVYDQYAQGLEGLAVPIIGPSFTFRKQLLGNDRVMLMGSLGATGFVAPWVMDSLLMFGAGASGGVTFGWQPTHGFGVFVPVELAAMAARHNNQQITAIPGLGLSWELWGARMKLASDWPLAILAHGGGGSWNHLTLGAVPYYGFEIGYRW